MDKDTCEEYLDDRRINEDFETFIEPIINSEVFRSNFKFLKEKVPYLLSSISSMISFTKNTAALGMTVKELGKKEGIMIT